MVCDTFKLNYERIEADDIFQKLVTRTKKTHARKINQHKAVTSPKKSLGKSGVAES